MRETEKRLSDGLRAPGHLHGVNSQHMSSAWGEFVYSLCFSVNLFSSVLYAFISCLT